MRRSSRNMQKKKKSKNFKSEIIYIHLSFRGRLDIHYLRVGPKVVDVKAEKMIFSIHLTLVKGVDIVYLQVRPQ